jgi:hypothetical protein
VHCSTDIVAQFTAALPQQFVRRFCRDKGQVKEGCKKGTSVVASAVSFNMSVLVSAGFF